MHSFRSQPFELGDTTIEVLERSREADLGRIRDTQCPMEEPDAFRQAIRRFATRLAA
jgi:hypothetical protein